MTGSWSAAIDIIKLSRTQCLTRKAVSKSSVTIVVESARGPLFPQES